MRYRRTAAIGIVLLTVVAGLAALAQHQDHDDHDATVHHRFDDVERWARHFDNPARDEWQKPEEVVRFLKIEEGAVVADLGAGTGYFSVHLARATGPDGIVFAVDIEPELIEHLQERAEKEGLPNLRAVLADRDSPELSERSTDLVFVCDTWHHIDDRLNYLGKLSRVLREGGRVAVVDFREGELPVGPPPGHKLTRDDVVAEFDKAGWRLVDEGTMLPYQYLLVFRPAGR